MQGLMEGVLSGCELRRNVPMKRKQSLLSPGKWKEVNVVKQNGAFPVKVEGPQLKASGNEVAIEAIEIAPEGLELDDK